MMVIVSFAFLPHNNDMAAGGVAKRVTCERIGRMAPAKKDTYKRVYKEDGSYHYPKTPNNLLRKKGEMYFESLEVTGSTTTKNGKDKFALTEFFKNTELPNLKQLAMEVERDTNKRVVVRYQMDGAGPHQDAGLQDFLRNKFDSHEWILKSQPAQSPLTNIDDFCIFPAMSKMVTNKQGNSNASKVLQTEQLWDFIQTCWNEFPLETVAHAYAGHHQIVNAIARDEGGDAFVREKKVLHFGIRKHCIPFFEGKNTEVATGVELVDCLEYDGEPSACNLRYNIPDVSELDMADFLNEQELHCLGNHLDNQQPEWFHIQNAIFQQRLAEEEETCDGDDQSPGA